MSLPANMTYDNIYDILDELDDTDNGGFKGTEIADFIERLSNEVEGKEVLAKAYKEHKIEIMKLKEENEKLKEEKEWVKQDGRDEKEAEYDKLAFVIGGQYEPNNPSLMISSVELMKQNNKKLKEENEKLKEENKKLKE